MDVSDRIHLILAQSGLENDVGERFEIGGSDDEVFRVAYTIGGDTWPTFMDIYVTCKKRETTSDPRVRSPGEYLAVTYQAVLFEAETGEDLACCSFDSKGMLTTRSEYHGKDSSRAGQQQKEIGDDFESFFRDMVRSIKRPDPGEKYTDD